MGVSIDYTTLCPVTNFPNLSVITGIGNNVFYESPENSFFDLCETTFLVDILNEIKRQYGSEFEEYNFYIYSSGWKEGQMPESAKHYTEKKKVLLFISDESGEEPYHLAPLYFAVFKIHLQSDKFSVSNIFNFPLGCEKRIPKLPVKKIKDRKYSVFFSGNLYSNRLPLFFSLAFNKTPNVVVRKGIRALLGVKMLKRTLTLMNYSAKFPDSFIRFTNGFKRGLPPEEYGAIMADSKIILCPNGFNLPECFRHYEAMRAGCVIISEKLPDTYFYKDSPIIQISNWEEGMEIAKRLLDNPEKMQKISDATYKWWQQRCSENATAKYIMNTLIQEEALCESA